MNTDPEDTGLLPPTALPVRSLEHIPPKWNALRNRFARAAISGFLNPPEPY
jgi:hypothetical protein